MTWENNGNTDKINSIEVLRKIAKIMNHKFSEGKILEILKSSRLFNKFNDDQLIYLISFSNVQQFDKGAKIIKENEANQNLYILLEGSVAVYVKGELIIKLGRKGDIIGEMSVITKSLTTASVVADTPVTLFTIPSHEIYSSRHEELHNLWFKIFSDILTEKLTNTTKKVIGFQETSAQLDIKKHELVQQTIILQSVLGSMADGVVVTGSNGELLHTNEAFARMVGNVKVPLDFEDWPHDLGLFMPDKKTLYPVSDLPMVKAGNGIMVDSQEIYVKNPNLEKEIWLQATSSLLKTDDGKKLDGTVAVFRNYTKQKLAEQALIDAKENAEATARAKSDFLSVMSHELRTPLNGIIGMSNLLKTTNLTDEQKECTASIYESGQSLLAKIQNILYYSLLESNEIQLRKASYSICEIIDNIIQKHKSLADEKKIAVIKDIDKNVPKNVLGDKEKISQILDNIMNNAVKFTSHGQVNIKVSVNKEDQDQVYLQFEVKDTGVGLTAEEKKKLFQPFTQADASYSRQFEGTGLGLSISLQLARIMEGSIQVKSIPGKGSSFIFNLFQSRPDREKQAESQDSAFKPEPLAYRHFAIENPLKILVAEDNKVNQLLIKKVLAKLGYAPIIVENGLKALNAAQKDCFDVILMDIQMPEMDGLEACRQILKKSTLNAPPKIIALTANTTDGIQDECLSAGMSGYMAKPLNIEKLMKILENIKTKEA